MTADRSTTQRSRAAFAASLLLILAAATVVRTLWLRADPPVEAPTGIVWHDEGPWVHNARNRALWGTWRTDDWNPVFVAPVFTALEYAAFRELGVGTWQARVVPVASGLTAIGFLMFGLRSLSTRSAAVAGGVLLATDYAFVTWNRAALMESTMSAFVVMAWACYARTSRRPWWGAAAGLCAALAFFTKAAAAFFVAALAADALYSWIVATRGDRRARLDDTDSGVDSSRAAIFTLAGLTAAFAVVGLGFVLPHWREYYFYNVTMSVLRKPSYGLRDFVDRASWLPVVQSFFSHLWPVFAIAMAALLAIAARWRRARPGERLLVLWMIAGLAELIVHDSGNERRYVMFIPAIVALASLWFGDVARMTSELARPSSSWVHRIVLTALTLFVGYLVAGSALRIVLASEVGARQYHRVVVAAAIVAVALAAAMLVRGAWLARRLARLRWPAGATIAVVAPVVIWNLVDLTSWLRDRHTYNADASAAIGRLLAPGTLVQGKLANGLALENRIRPLFIGNGFGNYGDRLERDDVRYILTYDLPKIGYESQASSTLIQDLLDRYPTRRVVAAFDVDETPQRDRAVLIEKRP
jgi:4-amino-4-deoxy-L-arabinose transferase-like glycosyltransferase